MNGHEILWNILQHIKGDEWEFSPKLYIGAQIFGESPPKMGVL